MGIHFKEKVKCTHVMPQCTEVLFQCVESCFIVLKFVPDSETFENKTDELCLLMKKTIMRMEIVPITWVGPPLLRDIHRGDANG